MRLRAVLGVAAAALFLASCALGGLKRGDPHALPPIDKVRHADALAAAGRPSEAREFYIEVLREDPGDTAAFRARWGMAWLRVDPKSPLLNYRAARINFDRLVARYGDNGGSWLVEAEAWRAALQRLEGCEGQVAELAADVDRLREVQEELDLLKQLDVDLEGQR